MPSCGLNARERHGIDQAAVLTPQRLGGHLESGSATALLSCEAPRGSTSLDCKMCDDQDGARSAPGSACSPSSLCKNLLGYDSRLSSNSSLEIVQFGGTHCIHTRHNHHHRLIPERFPKTRSPKRNRDPQTLAATGLLSVSVGFPVLDIS